VALTTHLHLAARLKKEYSYTSTPPLGFVVCSRANFTFTFTFTFTYIKSSPTTISHSNGFEYAVE
jgi:hypothetical protein